jgi:hypothetical protein
MDLLMKSFGSLLLSAAILAVAGAASAQTTVTTSVEHLSFKTGGATESRNALKTEVSGDYATGFAYDLTVSGGERAGAGVIGADFETRFLFGGLVGPAAELEWGEVSGVKSERALVGIAGAYDLSDAVSVEGSLLSDVDAFGDDFTASVTGAYAFNSDISLSGELEFARIGGDDARTGKIGASYGLTDSASVGGKLVFGDSDAVRVRGVEAGISLSF